MISIYFLQLLSILISLFLSYIFVNKASKYSKKIAKYKYIAYVTAFIFIYVGTLKIFSIFNPLLMENYESLLEHITIPGKFAVKPTTSIDTSIFQQKQITPSMTTVVSAPVDTVHDVPVAYVDPTSPPPTPFTYNLSTTGYSGLTNYTGYTGNILSEEYLVYTGYTGHTLSEESHNYTGYISNNLIKEDKKGEKEGKEKKNMDLGNMDMSQIMPFMMGLASALIEKQPQVNVNVYNDGETGGSNINKYNMDNCILNNKNNKNNKKDLYNYPAGKVRAYDEWKSMIDKDTNRVEDYIYVDQNKLNRNPRNSSCPVCPLDINYPFSNYRSGR